MPWMTVPRSVIGTGAWAPAGAGTASATAARSSENLGEFTPPVCPLEVIFPLAQALRRVEPLTQQLDGAGVARRGGLEPRRRRDPAEQRQEDGLGHVDGRRGALLGRARRDRREAVADPHG